MSTPSIVSRLVAGGAMPIPGKSTHLTYVGATDDVLTVTHKVDGVTQAVDTLIYDGSGRIESITTTRS